MKQEYIKTIIKCANCGKRMRIIKNKNLGTEGLLCQKCGQEQN